MSHFAARWLRPFQSFPEGSSAADLLWKSTLCCPRDSKRIALPGARGGTAHWLEKNCSQTFWVLGCIIVCCWYLIPLNSIHIMFIPNVLNNSMLLLMNRDDIMHYCCHIWLFLFFKAVLAHFWPLGSSRTSFKQNSNIWILFSIHYLLYYMENSCFVCASNIQSKISIDLDKCVCPPNICDCPFKSLLVSNNSWGKYLAMFMYCAPLWFQWCSWHATALEKFYAGCDGQVSQHILRRTYMHHSFTEKD